MKTKIQYKYLFIYKTTNLINRKVYIGQHLTNKLEDGYIGCGVWLQKYAIDNVIFHRAVRKYGYENFKREVIEFCENQEQLNEREKFWIKELHSHYTEGGYNMTWGGDGGDTITNHPRYSEICKSRRGHKQSQETKDKRKKSRKGYHHSEETRKKISLSNSGKIISEETRKKNSDSHKGRKQSIESVKKRSESNRGKIRSKESCKRISESRRGIVFSEKHIENLKISHTGKKQSKEQVEKKRKSMIGKNVGKIRTIEMKQRWSRSHLGKKLSKESIEKRERTRRENREKKVV